MKTKVKRHGFGRHGFDPEKVVCPDCKKKCRDIFNLEYIDEKYRITYECNNCSCLFEVESESLYKFI